MTAVVELIQVTSTNKMVALVVTNLSSSVQIGWEEAHLLFLREKEVHVVLSLDPLGTLITASHK